MTDEELTLKLCEALEKLEVLVNADIYDEFILGSVYELVSEVRDELRYGLGEM